MKSSHHLFFFLLILFSTVTVFISSDVREILFKNTKIDSFGHFLGFFCLTWALHDLVKLPLFNTAICIVLYAALTEIGQYYLGFRNGEFRDFIADVLAVLFFVLLKWIYVVYGNKLRL